MNTIDNVHQSLIIEAIFILLKVKEKLKDESDCVWTYYENAEQMRLEIDKYIFELEKGSLRLLDETYMHFLPTAGYQEHSMSNDWTIEYHRLAEKFDKIYEALKNYS